MGTPIHSYLGAEDGTRLSSRSLLALKKRSWTEEWMPPASWRKGILRAYDFKGWDLWNQIVRLDLNSINTVTLTVVMSPSCPFVIPSPQNRPPPLYSSRASSAEGIATCPWRLSSKVPHSANPLLTILKAQRPLWVTQDWPTLKSPCHFALPSAPLPPLDHQISEERDLACSIFAWHNSCLSYFEQRDNSVISTITKDFPPAFSHFALTEPWEDGHRVVMWLAQVIW